MWGSCIRGNATCGSLSTNYSTDSQPINTKGIHTTSRYGSGGNARRRSTLRCACILIIR